MRTLAPVLLLSALALAACGGESDETQTTPSSSSSSGAGGSGGSGGIGGSGGQSSTSSSSSQASGSGGAGGSGGAEACLSGSVPRPADAPRLVVAGHSGAATDTDYEVLSLASDGTLSTTGQHFAMGSASSSPIVFTPKGRVGFAPQKDGTLGVFHVKEDNTVEVLDAAFGKDQFYADSVLMAPSGDHFLVLDGNWANNGGGVYRVDIACDGALSVKGRLIDGKNPSAMLWADDASASELFITARELGPVKSGESLHRLSLSDPPTVLGGVDLFGDDEAIISAMGQTRDGKHLFIGDNSSFSGIDNRVAFAKIDGSGFQVTGVSSDVEDPAGFAASPFNDRVIVSSGFGDAVFVFAYDPASATPFTFQGEVAYPSGKPQLPGAPVMVSRGPLDGRVLIPEVRGVYQLQFKAGGVIENLGVTETETAIVDNLGVQP